MTHAEAINSPTIPVQISQSFIDELNELHMIISDSLGVEYDIEFTASRWGLCMDLKFGQICGTGFTYCAAIFNGDNRGKDFKFDGRAIGHDCVTALIRHIRKNLDSAQEEAERRFRA